VYSKAGRHAAAIKALNRALELDPSDWTCSFQIGELKREMGMYQEASSIFEAILVERPKEFSVLASLARTYLELGLMESNGGYHMRAEDSFLNAIDIALAIVNHHMKFRSIAWKVVSDAALRLSTRPVIHDNARVQHMIKSVRSLLFTEHATAIDLPSFRDLESPENLAVLRISIYACNLRAALDTSPSINQGSAWYDLGIGLQIWKNNAPTKNQPPEIDKEIVNSLTQALRADPSNDLYWNAFGNAHFSERPKIAQHAYIRSLELDPKVSLMKTCTSGVYKLLPTERSDMDKSGFAVLPSWRFRACERSVTSSSSYRSRLSLRLAQPSSGGHCERP
jgi:superkiller protein 3